MVRAILLNISLVILLGFCSHCKSDLNPRTETEDSTSTDPDTTIISPPDSIQTDIIITANSDSSLFASPRFGLENIFPDSNVTVKKGFYWKANDFIGRPVNLAYTFLAPENDSMKYRPFILFVHEGAFLFGSLENEMGKARQLSRKGYAVASIDYRLGFNGGSENNACGGNNKELAQAIYRSVQDTYVALHYFMNRAKEFGIDPQQIILAGSSAGAITISALLYMGEAEFEKLDPGISKVLGRLDPTPGGRSFKIKALLSSLGYAVVQSNYITANNAKPSLFFQRSGDNILAFERGKLFFCPEYFYTEGAKNVSDRLKNLKIPYELNYEPLAGHLLSYPEDYVVGRYIRFVKRLWNGDLRQVTNKGYEKIEDNVLK